MSLTPLQEWLIVELRKTLLLSNDDLWGFAQSFILPDLDLNTLECCLVKHCVSNIEALHPETEPPTLSEEFNCDEPGYVRIEAKTLPLMPNESEHKCLYIAFDFATHWVYLDVSNDKNCETASTFLVKLIKQAPFHIRVILTNHDDAFTGSSAMNKGGKSVVHSFSQTCVTETIEHRLIKQYNPLEEDMSELFNNITIQLENREGCWHEWKPMLNRYAAIYNHLFRLKSLEQFTPFNKLNACYIEFKSLFKKVPEDDFKPSSYLFYGLMYDLCEILSVFGEEDKLTGENKIRMNEIRNKRLISYHIEFFKKHNHKIFHALCDKSDTNINSLAFRFSIYERIYAQVSSYPFFSFNSEKELLNIFKKNILIPTIAIEVFTGNSTKSETSIYNHMHSFMQGEINALADAQSDDFRNAAKHYLRMVVAKLKIKSTTVAKDLADDMKSLINGITKRDKITAFRIKKTINKCIGHNRISLTLDNHKKTIASNEIEIKKFESACLAVLLFLEFERRSSMGKEFIHYYNDLINDKAYTLDLRKAFDESFHQSDLNIDPARYIKPITKILYESVKDELGAIPETFPIDGIFNLREFFNQLMSDNLSSQIIDELPDLPFHPIAEYLNVFDWPYRAIISPYNHLINVCFYIRNNNPEEALKWASETPSHESDIFGFLPAIFSLLYIALKIKLSNKISHHEFSPQTNNTLAHSGLFSNLNQLSTDTLDNPMLSSSYNIEILKSVIFYHQLIDYMAGNLIPPWIDPTTMAISGILDKVDSGVGKFLASLAEDCKDISLLDKLEESEFANLRTKFDIDYYRGNFISFLDESSLKNCIHGFRAIVSYLANPWERDRIPNISSLVEYEDKGKIPLLCSILPS